MTQDNDKKDRSLWLSTAQVTGSALAAMSGALRRLPGRYDGHPHRRRRRQRDRHGRGDDLHPVAPAHGPRREADRRRGPPTWGAGHGCAAPQGGRTNSRSIREEPGTPDRDEAAREDGEPADDDSSKGRWDLPWGKVAIASLAVMVAGLAGITAVEAITGEPVSSLLGADDGQGTTVGHVVGEDSSSKEDPAPKEDTPADGARVRALVGALRGAPGTGAPSTTPEPTTDPTEAPDLSEDEAVAPSRPGPDRGRHVHGP